jgi:dipeptidase D
MTGAQGLQAGYLNGEILLNLDTEEDDEIDIGCAGGIDVTLQKTYEEETLEQGEYSGFEIVVRGLQGGHSGMDIHKGLGNANKIMNRLLSGIEDHARIARINGGGLRNAIPRESSAIIACKTAEVAKMQAEFNKIALLIKTEFENTEPGLVCSLTETASPAKVLSPQEQQGLLNAVGKAINGVYRMSAEIEDLVETSNNIARVSVENGQMEILCLTRSSVEEGKMEVAHALKDIFDAEGFSAEFSGSYPGWTPNKDSAILKVLSDLYEEMFQSRPSVVACHAGLECGILGTHYPEMDMISFGPTIKGAHSPDERASISSAARFWKFLQEILKNIPVKD